MQPKNPLHGVTLKSLLESLVNEFGFEELGKQIPIKCFTTNPSINSSLVFLRKTPWARAKVENYYLWQNRLKAKALQKKKVS
ncbi:MAG TPA: VF530 family protein [Candidatus Paceibacterota bacterium]|nr:VF530 family protein [Candidatus Paceibacterota bacterium]HMO83133.1 VF530 family protein [Candidatus Paceibacterota bacterium]